MVEHQGAALKAGSSALPGRLLRSSATANLLAERRATARETSLKDQGINIRLSRDLIPDPDQSQGHSPNTHPLPARAESVGVASAWPPPPHCSRALTFGMCGVIRRG